MCNVIIIDNNPEKSRSHNLTMSATRIYLLLASIALGGCASTEANHNDPLEPLNRGVYHFNDKLDKVLIKPVARAYNKVTPEPMKNMVRNFFSNLDDVVVTINDLLQLKFAQAASDSARVVFNSTFGIFGLFNFADHLEKHNEDFGQTLGYWGISSGPYIVVPFFGPSNLRDGVGLYADSLSSPMQEVEHIPTRNQLYVAKVVSLRTDLMKQEELLDAAAVDRYAFIRDAYLQRRQSLVYDGDPPREKIEDEGNDGSPADSTGGEQPAHREMPLP